MHGVVGKQETIRFSRKINLHTALPCLVHGCRATHAAGVRSGRHRIGRSASPGRIVEK